MLILLRHHYSYLLKNSWRKKRVLKDTIDLQRVATSESYEGGDKNGVSP